MQHFNCFLVVKLVDPQTYPQDLWITEEPEWLAIS